jgi:hypothetical protein
MTFAGHEPWTTPVRFPEINNRLRRTFEVRAAILLHYSGNFRPPPQGAGRSNKRNGLRQPAPMMAPQDDPYPVPYLAMASGWGESRSDRQEVRYDCATRPSTPECPLIGRTSSQKAMDSVAEPG